jgi:ElaB/YqjD/DUF883 family membrane-anchored ribosome-binding protein
MSAATVHSQTAGDDGVDSDRSKTDAADLHRELQALREDFGRLTEQFTRLVADKGETAWERLKASAQDGTAGIREAEHEAADVMREFSKHLTDAIDDSLKTNPYATLAVAAGLGLLFGLTWRR